MCVGRCVVLAPTRAQRLETADVVPSETPRPYAPLCEMSGAIKAPFVSASSLCTHPPLIVSLVSISIQYVLSLYLIVVASGFDYKCKEE